MAASDAKHGKETADQKPDERTFEALVRRLEEVVGTLDAGDIPLEKALALFEEGVSLAREGHRRLEDAERRITVLLEDGTEKPLPAGGGDDASGGGAGRAAEDDAK